MSATTEEPDQTAQPANEDPEQMRQEQASTEAVEAEGDGDATPAATSKPSLCGVCNVNPPKYKCPRCYLPYCSVACNRTHRENHPPDPEPRPQIEQSQSQPPSDTRKLSEPLPSDSSNPFHALETSDKLRLLFQKYPNLPDQLLKIHAATLPPPETKSVIPASLLKGLPPKKETWNHDIGIQNGKEALRKARRADGEDGDAIREYSELILHLMNAGGAEADVGNLLRQQLAQEDTKLIERLMAHEKR
ncbi:zinc finger domain-containing [Fusarium albosuccineum]|uniref:Zinc finger domain-containing n=1 Tax=Fusarium albosuccineum TaxID=1237068 RepID=A0A8H4PH83_9HYPO|nr:zinc finger domain-containing [Fusarium albosuccineum]